jgi:hypothetical protein
LGWIKFPKRQERSEIPLNSPEAVKNSDDEKVGKRCHVQETGKIFLPKEALISSLTEVHSTHPRGQMETTVYLPRIA